jgi:hypothetical protein
MGGYEILADQGLPMSSFFVPGIIGSASLKTTRRGVWTKTVNRIAHPAMDRHKLSVLLIQYPERNSTMRNVLV